MNAKEFIKKYGWDKAKEVVSFTSNVCANPTHFDSDLDIYVHQDDFNGVMDESDVCINDLKQYIDAYELVNACGGVYKVKEYLKDGNVFRFEEKPLMRQNLALVEEINA